MRKTKRQTTDCEESIFNHEAYKREMQNLQKRSQEILDWTTKCELKDKIFRNVVNSFKEIEVRNINLNTDEDDDLEKIRSFVNKCE